LCPGKRRLIGRKFAIATPRQSNLIGYFVFSPLSSN